MKEAGLDGESTVGRSSAARGGGGCGWSLLPGGSRALRGRGDPALFATAALADATTVVWGGDEDLAIDSLNLALLADQQRPFGAAELAAWQQRLELSSQEAAALVRRPMRPSMQGT